MAPAGAANASGHDTQQIQEEELQAMRAIFGDDWKDIPSEKTAWGTAAQSGWWQVRLKAHEGKVGVTLKGKFLKVRLLCRAHLGFYHNICFPLYIDLPSAAAKHLVGGTAVAVS